MKGARYFCFFFYFSFFSSEFPSSEAAGYHGVVLDVDIAEKRGNKYHAVKTGQMFIIPNMDTKFKLPQLKKIIKQAFPPGMVNNLDRSKIKDINVRIGRFFMKNDDDIESLKRRADVQDIYPIPLNIVVYPTDAFNRGISTQSNDIIFEIDLAVKRGNKYHAVKSGQMFMMKNVDTKTKLPQFVQKIKQQFPYGMVYNIDASRVRDIKVRKGKYYMKKDDDIQSLKKRAHVENFNPIQLNLVVYTSEVTNYPNSPDAYSQLNRGYYPRSNDIILDVDVAQQVGNQYYAVNTGQRFMVQNVDTRTKLPQFVQKIKQQFPQGLVCGVDGNTISDIKVRMGNDFMKNDDDIESLKRRAYSQNNCPTQLSIVVYPSYNKAPNAYDQFSGRYYSQPVNTDILMEIDVAEKRGNKYHAVKSGQIFMIENVDTKSKLPQFIKRIKQEFPEGLVLDLGRSKIKDIKVRIGNTFMKKDDDVESLIKRAHVENMYPIQLNLVVYPTDEFMQRNSTEFNDIIFEVDLAVKRGNKYYAMKTGQMFMMQNIDLKTTLPEFIMLIREQLPHGMVHNLDASKITHIKVKKGDDYMKNDDDIHSLKKRAHIENFNPIQLNLVVYTSEDTNAPNAFVQFNPGYPYRTD